MAAKKKTVSELNKFVESLVEKVEHLLEEVKYLRKFDGRIKHIEDNINQSDSIMKKGNS